MTSKNKSLVISAHQACHRHMHQLDGIFALVEQIDSPLRSRIKDELKSLAMSTFQQKQELEVLAENTSKSITWH